MTDLLKECFRDSKIAQNMSLKKPKGRQIVTNVIGATEKSELIEILKKTKFSILTDESTDISVTKTSCVLTRFYGNQENQIVS